MIMRTKIVEKLDSNDFAMTGMVYKNESIGTFKNTANFGVRVTKEKSIKGNSLDFLAQIPYTDVSWNLRRFYYDELDGNW